MGCSNGCTGSCGCEEGVSLEGFTNGADAPTITNIQLNSPANTLTVTLSDGSSYTTNAITVSSGDAAILLYSLTSTQTLTGTGLTFSEIDSFSVDTDDYFTQNGDVLEVSMVLWHNSPDEQPAVKFEVNGNNLAQGNANANSALYANTLAFDAPNAFGGSTRNLRRGMKITAIITRRTDTNVEISYYVNRFGVPYNTSTGSSSDLVGLVGGKEMHTALVNLNVSDLTSNPLVFSVDGAPFSTPSVDINLEEFNVKYYKLIT